MQVYLLSNMNASGRWNFEENSNELSLKYIKSFQSLVQISI